MASGFIILAQFAFFLLIGVSLWVFYREFPPSEGVGSGGVAGSDQVFTYFIVHYLPTGILGLVIAAIFSAAMGTLAGSLNSSASTIVNDLYRPLTGRNDERHLMRVSRAMTVAWGLILAAVAFGARLLEDNVVNNALAIAGLVSGILLGLFLLGILTRRVGPDRRHWPGCSRGSPPCSTPSSAPRSPGRGSPWSARPRSSPSAWRRATSSRPLPRNPRPPEW